MRVGYACQLLGVPEASIHTCTRKYATAEKLEAVIEANLSALDAMLSYNLRHRIQVFRISSDIIPFASHPIFPFDWKERFRDCLEALGQKARNGGLRLSMHPGQYTVLNSPDEDVVERAVKDLAYHCDFLDMLGMGRECKVILHVGGAYSDKAAALARFQEQYGKLDESIRRRLVIENDDRIYTIAEVLKLGKALDIPVVFDNLHHAVNPPEKEKSIAEWIAACASTWKPQDGPQKIHYSQQAEKKKAGAHSQTICIEPFLRFCSELPPQLDIMLEVKDKNLSAVKCMLCLERNGKISLLEDEWARYKYSVLEHDPEIYQRIRALLKDKSAYPAVAFYRLIEEALQTEPSDGQRINAAQHVWGYFKDSAISGEKARFAALIDRFSAQEIKIDTIKRFLYRMATKHEQAYLVSSYYFVLP